MTTYRCNDGNAEIDIEAESPQDAAQQYVDGGEWGESTNTSWIHVYVQELDADGEAVDSRHNITVEVNPDEPECEDDGGHDWQSPHGIVGGIKENPGVWGHGGGIVIVECCIRCGCKRTTDTWAQDHETGEQGLRSVEYEPEKWAEEISVLRGN